MNPHDFHDLEPLARAQGRRLSYVCPVRPDVDHWLLDGRRYETTEVVRAALEGGAVQLSLWTEGRKAA